MPQHSPDRQKAFLTKLVKRLSVEPSTALNSRCLSQQTLYGVLDELESQDFRLQYPKSRIVSWLQETGLLAVIPVTQAKPGTRTNRFYSFDIAKSPSSHVTPLELLQAC